MVYGYYFAFGPELQKACWRIILLFVFASFVGSFAGAHGNKHPDKKTPIIENTAIAPDNRLAQINSSYRSSVRLIFEAKCFDCHSNKTKYPWYHSLPGVKQLIDADVAEGLKHLDMSNDFPFGGHGSPVDDLEAIKKEVVNREMPPMRYRIMHSGSSLTAAEIDVITKWLEQSSAILKLSH